jgi:nitroimidazol reductase NimA-like FMN-containing flavoprotein (pyridoxamine 5'-phosphate oxidase superfamily)
MSASAGVRRADKVMPDDLARAFLEGARVGRLATVSADGSPYVIPLLYVPLDGEIWLHNAAAQGHLRSNIEREPRACFEIDEAGEVFDYGRFECDSSIAYRSVLAFGVVRIVTDRADKQRFCEALMARYGKPDTTRPKGFFPQLDHITVYAMRIERLTAKETALPPLAEQWPAQDRTRTPTARPPKG